MTKYPIPEPPINSPLTLDEETGAYIHLEEKRVFFWHGVFSNWHSTPFLMPFIDNERQRFNCSEQALMACKALEAGDTNSIKSILSAQTPKEQKALGRAVKGLDVEIWEQNRQKIMELIIHFKFRSTPKMAVIRTRFRGWNFVEASPLDAIWGVKMSVSDHQILDPINWKGLNILGKAFDNVFSI